ncbi:polyprenyl synthetase family protein [Streptomyces lavendulae]|uniref:polyprenyl synthetase family protein n=1 Tax=Streptomyces lavendulae TaxID=1914 RepID=UPI0033ED5965
MTASPAHVAAPVPELDLPGIRHAVDARLDAFLTGKKHQAAGQRLPAEVPSVLVDFLFAGGKRLRPLLCVCGWYAGGGHGDETGVIQAAAALEMFHAFALIHDDLMDHSATRRGHPTVHRTLAAHHGGNQRLGASSAVLIGDLALTWSDELLHTAPLTPAQLTAVLPVIDTMRTEVMYGQYLDLIAAGHPTDGDTTIPLKIIRYKTAKYTIERPLHTGATLAGAPHTALAALSKFALPLGEAFQLRDDLLGVFGDPGVTGKPALDDLRDGKHTVLITLALQRAAPTQRAVLHALIGSRDLDEAGAARIRRILIATGARAETEHMIRTRQAQAHRALRQASLPPPAAAALRRLADSAVARTS